MASGIQLPKTAKTAGDLRALKETAAKLQSVGSGNQYFPTGIPNTWMGMHLHEGKIPPMMKASKLAQEVLEPDQQVTVSIPFTEADQAAVKEQEDATMLADLYGEFFETCKPFQNPWALAYYRELWPEPFEAIEKFIKDMFELNLSVQMALIHPESKEALILKLMVNKYPELIKLLEGPMGPIKDATAGAADRMAEKSATSMVRGAFNPHEWGFFAEAAEMFRKARAAGSAMSRTWLNAERDARPGAYQSHLPITEMGPDGQPRMGYGRFGADKRLKNQIAHFFPRGRAGPAAAPAPVLDLM